MQARKISNKIILVSVLLMCISFWQEVCYGRSIRHHLIEAGRNVCDGVLSPFKGAFITGPKNVKKAWDYEVHEREKEEQRGKLRYKLFAVWRAPGEELKGIVDGITGSVTHLGQAIKEVISIFFSD